MGWNAAPSMWRRRVALIAIICGSVAALAQPVIFLVLSLHQKAQVAGQG